MTATTAARFGVKYRYAVGESGWKPGMDYNLGLIDAAVSCHLIANATTTPPGSPSDGDAYFVPTSASGVWSTHVGTLAAWQGGQWDYYTVPTGLRAYVDASGNFEFWNGTTWALESTLLTGFAPLASPTFTGTPAGPTASPGTNTTQFATTAFVAAGLALMAPLASPTLTGTPAAPTASLGTNTTQIATTGFVAAAVSALINSAPGILDTLGEIAAQLSTDEGAVTALTTVVAGKAPLASPTFTGTPAAPTASGGANTTQIATTAFVHGELTTYAPIASPTFTGTPITTTPASPTDNTTKIASTAWVTAYVAQNTLAFSNLPDEAQNLPVAVSHPGTMTASEVIMVLPIAETLTIPASLVGTYVVFNSTELPTATMTLAYSSLHAGTWTNRGTLSISTAGSLTITGGPTVDITLVPGDGIRLVGQLVPDATAANFGVVTMLKKV